MSRHYTSYRAICPFYREEDKNIIYCEGVERGSSIHNAFPGSADKYKEHYCSDSQGWKACIIAKALWSKYEKREIPK